MSWTWGANSSFTELTFLRRVCFSPRPSGRFRPIKGFGRVDESTAGGGPCGRFITYLPYLSTVDTDEMMRAVLEFLRTARELAPIKVQHPWGTVYRDDRFPLIHQANLAWVSAVPDDGPEPILADMDQAFRGTAIRHRALLFEDAERAYAVQEEFIRRGFRPTAELAMAKVGLPDCIVNREVEIRSAAEGEAAEGFRSVMRATDAAFGHPPEVLEQMGGLRQDWAHQVGMRPYLATLNDAPAGTFSVWPRDGPGARARRMQGRDMRPKSGASRKGRSRDPEGYRGGGPDGPRGHVPGAGRRRVREGGPRLLRRRRPSRAECRRTGGRTRGRVDGRAVVAGLRLDVSERESSHPGVPPLDAVPGRRLDRRDHLDLGEAAGRQSRPFERNPRRGRRPREDPRAGARVGPDPGERGGARLDRDGPLVGPHAGPGEAGGAAVRGRCRGRDAGDPTGPVRGAPRGRRPDRVPALGAGGLSHRKRHPDRWRIVPRHPLGRVTHPASAPSPGWSRTTSRIGGRRCSMRGICGTATFPRSARPRDARRGGRSPPHRTSRPSAPLRS